MGSCERSKLLLMADTRWPLSLICNRECMVWLVYYRSAPPQKEERLVLALQDGKKIAGWVGPTKKDMGRNGKQTLMLIFYMQIQYFVISCGAFASPHGHLRCLTTTLTS